MSLIRTVLSTAAVALALGCTSTAPSDGGADAADGADTADAAVGADLRADAMVQEGEADAAPQASQLPSWSLEDIQPDSSRFGTTYGLDVFSGRVIVAVLVDGF